MIYARNWIIVCQDDGRRNAATNARGTTYCKPLHTQFCDRANFSAEKKNAENIFDACHVAIEEIDDIWYLYSGCTNHVIGN